jgi:hypothetical protein
VTASTIISIISAVLALAKFLVGYAQQQEWMERGAADEVLKSLKESDDAIARAQSARQSARTTSLRDPAGVLRDDDGFKRD